VSEAEQLAALGRIHDLLEGEEIDYWLFGGWAVDFHAGSITLAQDDLDIAVWLEDYDRIAAMLASVGWKHTPEKHEAGYTRYQRGTVRIELAFLARSDDGRVYTPLPDGRGDWPDETFQEDVAELAGVRARVITLRALKADKAEVRDDQTVAAKDRADSGTLADLC
jgi:Aminoglycoside-2''-adenylyltransferase